MSVNVSLPRLPELGPAACNLEEFPVFLQNQEALYWLDLSQNNIRGEVHMWASFSTLVYMNLSNNFLTRTNQSPLSKLFIYVHDGPLL